MKPKYTNAHIAIMAGLASSLMGSYPDYMAGRPRPVEIKEIEPSDEVQQGIISSAEAKRQRRAERNRKLKESING